MSQTCYVAPRSTLAPVIGDIVLYDHQQWDVVGLHTMAAPDEAGYQPVTVRLERFERPNGRKKSITATADSRDVVVLGQQPGLPEMPAPPAPTRAMDTG